MGRWVLKEACRQTRELQERCGPAEAPLTVGVNLSARQLQAADLVEDVSIALSESGLSPQALLLEITESALIGDACATVLQDLKALGVKLAIDDFGKGYSSLCYLEHFPVDALKIDRSFVGRLGQDATGTALVSAVIGLARALGLETVAEGVETADQLQHLLDLGCHLAQGFYFELPLEPEALSKLLQVSPATGGLEKLELAHQRL